MASSNYPNPGKTLLTLLLTCALAALVWFAGPQIRFGETAPLAPFMSRYLVTGGLLSLWAAVTLFQVFSRRGQASNTDSRQAAGSTQVEDSVDATETLLMSNFGYYGKPGNTKETPNSPGESIVHYNLPVAFVTVWHDWLSELMHQGATGYPDKWPALYQPSPAWRFAFSAGIAGDIGWAGIMLPTQAVDNRHFPLCFAAALPGSVRAAEAPRQLDSWYASLEKLAQQLCKNGYDLNQWQKHAQQFATSHACTVEPGSSHAAAFDTGNSGSAGSVSVRINTSQALHTTIDQLPLLDALLTQTFYQYSVWTTSPDGTSGGSDTVIASGLPTGMQGLALFSRDWAGSGCGNLLIHNLQDSQRQLRKPLEKPPAILPATAIK